MVHNKVTIIGSGPAAHTAAIYLARAEIKPTLYEGMMANGVAAGGQLTTTTEIENFPGFPEGLTGSELMDKMRLQSTKFGTEIITETLWTEFNEDEEPVTTDAIILATGASAKRMHLPGEETYWQKGISACAVCDGAVPIFRNKPLAVIGGGDSACEEAQFLTKYGSKVFMLVRKDHLRASTIMQRRSEQNEKIEILYNTVALEAKGNGKLLNALRIKNVQSNEETDLPVNGLFYAIGHTPATKIVADQVNVDEAGYIKTVPGSSLTSVPGFFAAGDVQDSKYRQAITSAGSGCMAALDAEKYLSALE
ncbi:thioredoxin-disulfide reductase [Saccharomyces pastorianus]|uniref:Thioredoxin reductase n=1 Tax=Saccharomyces pastorianus TaxID=27292 RepID=A0A6C1E3X3_SACPS|nr:thioredoxin-disulfide reductase [Saccharomyces pastorianus]